MPEDVAFTPRRVAVLLVFAGTVAGFVYGIRAWDWYLTELVAVFVALGLVTALVGGLGPDRVAGEFCRGAADLTKTALLIGFARTIEVVLTEGQVIDTVINGLAQPLQALPRELSAIGMLAVQTVCNFFIPSGSGQAYVTMPIMAPLSDLTDLSRQTAVLAYQFGDGFTNMIVADKRVADGNPGVGEDPLSALGSFRVAVASQVVRRGYLGASGRGSGRILRQP